MKKINLIIVTLAAAVLLSGCIAVDGYFKNVRNKVFSSVDGSFDKEVEFSFGAAMLTLSSVAVNFSDAPEFTDDMIRKIDRVQIGVYRNNDRRNFRPDFASIKNITDELKEDGYDFIVRSVNHDDLVLVTVKSDEYKIREMFVVALSDEEMVMTQIFGDLDELMEIAIREQGFDVEVAHN